MEYIISQIFVVLSYALLGSTYVLKNRKTILLISVGAIVCNAIGFGFLGAWSGVAMSVFALVRNFIFLIQNRKEKSEKIQTIDWVILGLLIAASAVIAYFTYDTFWSLLSIFATLTYTISVWQKNVTVYKILGIASSVLWIAYGVFIASFFSIVLESVLLIVEVIGAVKDYKEKKKENLKV